MKVYPLGKANVVVAGTRLSLASLLPTDFPADHKFAKLILCQITGSTGKVGFGTNTIVLSTHVGCIKEFAIPGSTTFTDVFELNGETESGNPFNADDYSFDSSVNNEGVIASLLVR